MDANKEKRFVSVALFFSVLSSALLILINVFRWHLIEQMTMIFEPLLELFIILLVLTSMILSVVYVIRHVQKEKLKAVIPLVISLISILIVWFTPFKNIALEWDFKENLKEREIIISMIQTGELRTNNAQNDGLGTLPKAYAHLSAGGEVAIEREGKQLKILFFTFRGIMSASSGFIYISDDSGLSSDDFNTEFIRVEKKRACWYWATLK